MGEEFGVSPANGLEHSSPSVGVDWGGNAVVMWITSGPVLETSEIWGQAVTKEGLLGGAPVLLQTGSGYDYYSPEIAGSASGTFTLAWVQRDQETDAASIMTQQLDRRVVPLGTPQQVNTSDAQSFLLGGIAVGASGVATIDWEARVFERGTGWYERSFDDQGEAVGHEVLVNPPYSE